MRTLLLLLAALTLSSTPVTAAVQTPLRLPQSSPAASVSQVVGAGTVAIEYHRPAVRGRAIWGSLVPYGEVWRTGANEATTIRFSEAARVAGKEVPAGTYALFAIPTPESWTLILNKQHAQWGAFKYAVAEDQLRFEVKPVACAPQEFLRYAIEPKAENAATVKLAWEKLSIEFEVEFSDKIVLAQIDAAIAGAKPDDAGVYLTAARYYYDHNLSSERASEWIDKSIAITDAYRSRELKARLADRSGKKAEAVAQVEKAIELAQGKAPQAYIDGLNKLLAEYRTK
jgi:hypothetical protein